MVWRNLIFALFAIVVPRQSFTSFGTALLPRLCGSPFWVTPSPFFLQHGLTNMDG